jgi:hypothetical protein
MGDRWLAATHESVIVLRVGCETRSVWVAG